MSVTASTITKSPVREGDVLAGKYRVEKVLGIGGMGVVVAAKHIELGQILALKFLLPGAAQNEELVERFLREARASVRLKGEHIAKVHDVGKLDDGCPYIVMEYLEGRDIGAEIKTATEDFAVETVATYVLHACQGLAEAHSLGIVHRDLKPGNLFLTTSLGGRPMVKILDFGISKTIDPMKVGDELSLTKTEMLLGSPLYMSPEQMRSSKHIDARTDIWGLGAIAYEMLCGKVPFEASSLMELCFKVAQEDAEDVAKLRPDLPPELCKAVMRCLEKDVDKRWSNVAELAAAIEPFASAREKGAAERVADMLKVRTTLRSTPDFEEVAKEAAKNALVDSKETTAPSSRKLLSSPEVAPAAWGTATKAEQKAKASRRGVYAIAAVAIVGLLVVGYGMSRTKPPPVGITPPSALPVDPPPPVVDLTGGLSAAPPSTGAPTDTAAASPPATKGPTNTNKLPPPPPAASSARIKPPGSATAPPTPADSAGFIKVRE
jgi:serine/threonine-protein kinase